MPRFSSLSNKYVVDLFPTKIGVPSVRLTFRIYPNNDKNPTVNLVPLIKIDGYNELPFAYQFLEATDERPYPIVKVVAGPGVNVVLENLPQDSFVSEYSGIPFVDVIRVQDPRIVPALATNIVTQNYITRYEISGSKILRHPCNEDYFVIETKRTGLVINNYFRNRKYIISVPLYTTSLSDQSDAYARFGYQIRDLVDTAGDSQLITFVKFGKVKIEASVISKRPQCPADSRQLLSVGEFLETSNIEDIGPDGSEISRKRNWKETTVDSVYTPTSEEVRDQLFFDLVIGFAPIVGTLVDIAEFVYATRYRKDKWGGTVSGYELAIMGIAALIPFVSGAALKRSIKIARKFKNYTNQAVEAVEMLKDAKVSPKEVVAIREGVQRIFNGEAIADDLALEFAKVTKKTNVDSSSVDKILNVDGSGFVHNELNTYYQNYRIKLRGRALTAKEWARTVTVGRPREILERLLGEDYVRRTNSIGKARNFKNLGDIPRPKDYIKQRLDNHIKICWKSRDQLLERMDNFIGHVRNLPPELKQRAISEVNEGYLRILKGNIGEILSRPEQTKVLAEVAIKYPDVQLISGVKIKLLDSKNAVLFSDNILGTFRGGNLQVRGVIEVKAGYEGGAEATDQIFDWIEGRLDEGAKLIIPSKAKAIDRKGREMINTKVREFEYFPGRSGNGRVDLLMSADRYIITTKGVSHLGIRSSNQIAPNVKRIELEDITSEEIDYLMKILLPQILLN